MTPTRKTDIPRFVKIQILTIALLVPTLAIATSSKQAIVWVPVADVWSRPLAPGETPADNLRETQILYMEPVLIHESSGPWVRIEAIKQQEFTHHNKWEGYPGWVLQKYLTDPPHTIRLGEDSSRPVNIIDFAQNLVGAPYLWGGLTKSQGLDCSGLVHLAYRKGGYPIPRDAYEQWMKATPIHRSQLEPSDLIFSAKIDAPKEITHVALYAGDGQIIEAPQAGMVVRKISFQEKYGKPFANVESGDVVGERVIYFGTFHKLECPASGQ